MTMLNVIANLFNVPLILGEASRREAIAVRLLEESKIEVTNTNRASARAVVEHVVHSGDDGTLDPLIGRYAGGESDKILGTLRDGLSATGEDRELQRELLTPLLDRLVEYLEDHPRDIGNPTP